MDRKQRVRRTITGRRTTWLVLAATATAHATLLLPASASAQFQFLAQWGTP
jgi:hypothetical protein